jgi:hypothetical protein
MLEQHSDELADYQRSRPLQIRTLANNDVSEEKQYSLVAFSGFPVFSPREKLEALFEYKRSQKLYEDTGIWQVLLSPFRAEGSQYVHYAGKRRKDGYKPTRTQRPYCSGTQ